MRRQLLQYPRRLGTLIETAPRPCWRSAWRCCGCDDGDGSCCSWRSHRSVPGSQGGASSHAAWEGPGTKATRLTDIIHFYLGLHLGVLQCYIYIVIWDNIYLVLLAIKYLLQQDPAHELCIWSRTHVNPSIYTAVRWFSRDKVAVVVRVCCCPFATSSVV